MVGQTFVARALAFARTPAAEKAKKQNDVARNNYFTHYTTKEEKYADKTVLYKERDSPVAC